MFRTYVIKQDQVLITSKPIQNFDFQVGLPTGAIMSFAFSEQALIRQWDNAIKQLLNIPNGAKYIIIDIGKPVSPGVYRVPALLADSEIARFVKSVSNKGHKSSFNNT